MVIIVEQLGNLIVSTTLSNQYKEEYRLAARGIIYKDGKLLMIHCAYFNDYTFPGGGVENKEEVELALRRECMEEAGVIVGEVTPFYSIMEKRELDGERYLMHESYFYLCTIKDFCEQRLESYEVELGYKPVWITVSDAIKFNEIRRSMLTDTDYKGVLEREIRILNELLKNGY